MTLVSEGESSMKDWEKDAGRRLSHRRIEHVGQAVGHCSVMGGRTLDVLENMNQTRYHCSQVFLLLPLRVRSSHLVDVLTS